MKPRHEQKSRAILDEIRAIAQELPEGKARQIANRCGKLSIIIKKLNNKSNYTTMNEIENYTQEQIADRYIAKKAVLVAMLEGRRITFLDSREFQVSEMHTIMCQIRQDIERKSMPYELKGRWVTFGTRNKRCKEYWIEKVQS